MGAGCFFWGAGCPISVFCRLPAPFLRGESFGITAICGAGGGFGVGMAAIRHVLSLKLPHPFYRAFSYGRVNRVAAHINRQGNKIATALKVQAAFRVSGCLKRPFYRVALKSKMQPARHTSRIKHPFGQQHDADHVAEHAQMNQLEMTAAELAAAAQGHGGKEVAEHAQCQ